MNIFNDGDGLLFRNPLRMVDSAKIEKTVLNSSFGAVLARAGTGKTALIIQLAIDTILKKNSVIHISFNQQVDKVNSCYKEILNNLEKNYNIDDIDKFWDRIQSNLFIMAFKVKKFDVSTFKKKIGDFIEQKIFQPNVIIIDGLPINIFTPTSITSLKLFSKKHSLHLWFTAIKHRNDEIEENTTLTQLADFEKMFDDILQLKQKHNKIYIESLKISNKKVKNIHYFLDPYNLTIRNI